MREHFALYNRIIENTAYSNDLELFACTILLRNLASSAGNPRTLKIVESQKPLPSDIDSEFDNYATASNVFTSRRKYAIHRTIASNHSFHSNQSRCELANSYRISMRGTKKAVFSLYTNSELFEVLLSGIGGKKRAVLFSSTWGASLQAQTIFYGEISFLGGFELIRSSRAPQIDRLN